MGRHGRGGNLEGGKKERKCRRTESGCQLDNRPHRKSGKKCPGLVSARKNDPDVPACVDSFNVQDSSMQEVPSHLSCRSNLSCSITACESDERMWQAQLSQKETSRK